MALGWRGKVAARFLKKSAMRFQASGGFQSIKKQGPPPWGMNQVGILAPVFADAFVMSFFLQI
jgi:hypothetical protein